MAKIGKTKEKTGYLSNKFRMLDIILTIFACIFDICLQLDVILH